MTIYDHISDHNPNNPLKKVTPQPSQALGQATAGTMRCRAKATCQIICNNWTTRHLKASLLMLVTQSYTTNILLVCKFIPPIKVVNLGMVYCCFTNIKFVCCLWGWISRLNHVYICAMVKRLIIQPYWGMVINPFS